MTDAQILDLWIIAAFPGNEWFHVIEIDFDEIMSALFYNSSLESLTEVQLALRQNNPVVAAYFNCWIFCPSSVSARPNIIYAGGGRYRTINFDTRIINFEPFYHIVDPWCFAPTKDQLMLIFAKYWYQKSHLFDT